MLWNNRGTALIIVTATDTSADSYYGESGLHFLSIKGESCLVSRGTWIVYLSESLKFISLKE